MTNNELREMGFGSPSEPQADQLIFTFKLRDQLNIDRAERVLRTMKVRHSVEERGLSLEFGFFSEHDLNRVRRNVRINIDRSKEGREWN